MSTTRKCVICNEPILDEPSVPYKGRYAHQRCFNVVIQTLHKDKKEKIESASKSKKTNSKKRTTAELKGSLSEEEYKEKQRYANYLKQLLNEEKLSAKIYAVTDDYIRKYKFSYEGMYKTLVYLNEIIEKELTGDIVGIIPYYYNEAKQYYASVDKIENVNKDIDISQMYHEKTIHIKPPNRKIKQLDITTIKEGEDE